MSILTEIITYKKEELRSTKSRVPLSELQARIGDAAPAKSFKSAIRRNKGEALKLIAELKKASPSKGLIRSDFDPSEIASIYDKNPVAAISVLTESRYFQGSLDYLNQVRKRTEKPLLRKDFIVDEYQVYEARANSADALLLIVAALEKSQLSDLYGLASELSLDCLVEVHNWKELDTALYCGANIVGINNRNLKTMDISLNITMSLLQDIPDDKVVVSESGIGTRSDVELIEATRTDTILVGTTIMKADDIALKINELMKRS